MKRLSTLTLTCPSGNALSCLFTVQDAINVFKLNQRFPRLQSLLDDDGRICTGIYNPFMDDPDMCNPFATTMWEIPLLAVFFY